MTALLSLFAFLLMANDAPAAPTTTATRLQGPAGSLVLLEENHAVPVVQVLIAFRGGSADDPAGREGLTHLAAELARRGGGGRTREDIDAAFDALGATLDVDTDFDSVRLAGQVLAANLEPFLALVADVVLRPTLRADELERTRRELVAQVDELRTDDTAVAARFFARRLYGAHPYGRPSEGTKASLEALTLAEAKARWKALVRGPGTIVAAAGDVTPAAFTALVGKAFASLPAGPHKTSPAPTAPSHPPKGWRIQVVDKPDRQQVQIMIGHVGLPAVHPDHLALQIAIASFGGHGMKATLMDEVRTRRGLAYGAYMTVSSRRGAGPIRAYLATGNDRAVSALKLVLRLYRGLKKKGLPEDRVRFFQQFLAGSHAADTDDPARRLAARVVAEVNGLPPDHLDRIPERLRARTVADVNAALKAHVQPEDLAITLVGTADDIVPRLVKSGIERGAIDVVPYDQD